MRERAWLLGLRAAADREWPGRQLALSLNAPPQRHHSAATRARACLDVDVFVREVGDGVRRAPRDAAAARDDARDGGGLVGAQQLDEARQRARLADLRLVLGLDRQQAQDEARLLLDLIKPLRGGQSMGRGVGGVGAGRGVGEVGAVAVGAWHGVKG